MSDVDGDCESCGSELVLSFFLNEDDGVDVAIVCPNCDQIEPRDPIHKNDAVDFDD